MTKDEIMDWLGAHGSEQTRKVLRRHGARDPFYGVKIADMKKVLKMHRNNNPLAMQLWDTGNSDAMYLATLMADARAMSKKLLRAWMKEAYWHMLSESGVAALAAEGAHGWELGMEWISSTHETIAAAGWVALSSWLSLHDDAEVDYALINTHLHHIGDHIHSMPNRVRYTMNNYVINVAVYVGRMYAEGVRIAERIGKVHVDMGDTSCKIPLASAYIKKIADMGRVGRKRARARCIT